MKFIKQTLKHLWLALALGAGTALADTPVLDIYLARHGQTDWNLEKRLQGGTDNPLNDTGRLQAKQLGVKLSGVPITAVYSSGLVRAKETAALALPAVKATPLAALSERSFGKFEGMYEDGRDAAMTSEFKARGSQPDDALEDGESLNSQASRVAKAIEQIRKEHANGSILVISHGGVTPLILGHLLKLPVPESISRIKQSNDEVYLVRLIGQQPPQVFKLITRETLEQL